MWALGAFLSVAVALVAFEKPAVPTGWALKGRAQPDTQITLYFFVPFRGGLEEELLERSSPSSKVFRQWLTHEEVVERFADRAGLEEVRAWLAPLRPSVEGSNVVKVRLAVARAELLLGTQFGLFRRGKHAVVRATAPYALPERVAARVAFVGGVREFPAIRRARVRSGKSRAGLAITPRVIRDRYGTGDTRSTAANNSQAVAQFLGQFFWETDLQEFFALYSREDLGRRPIKVGPDTGVAGVEASLDIEYIMAVGRDVKTYFWSTPGLHDNQEPFLEWIINVTAAATPPLINSVSYGDDEPSLSVAYMQAVNTVFASLGVRGLTVLFASGDNGVCGGDGSCTPFVPSFPASSPYCTAVGGTSLAGVFETGPEVAWSGSGGGFSNVFPMPAYQRAAVASYLSRNKGQLPSSSLYNASGRCYPDVAAFSTGFAVVSDLVPQLVDGTSCATPTFSGVMSLVNGARLAAGKPALGFLNPWLYGTAAPAGALTDITQGNNGFPCSAGYDPVTGWGSPLFLKLAALD